MNIDKINLFYKEINATTDKDMAIVINSEVIALGYIKGYDDSNDEYDWLVDNIEAIEAIDPYFSIDIVKYDHEVSIHFSDGFIKYIDSINNTLAVTKAIMLVYDKHKFCKLLEEVGV